MQISKYQNIKCALKATVARPTSGVYSPGGPFAHAPYPLTPTKCVLNSKKYLKSMHESDYQHSFGFQLSQLDPLAVSLSMTEFLTMPL